MACDRSNLAWRLNWYRHSELEGALLLGRMVRTADDPQLVLALTRHCADEARHAWLWARTIAELNLPTVQIFRSYQSFYADEGGAPGNLLEVLALTHIFEQRVDTEFRRELQDRSLPAAAVRTFRALVADEQDHLDWVGRWLAEQPGADAVVERFKRIDEAVYERIQPHLDNIAGIAGLGRELPCDAGAATFVEKEMNHVAH